MSRFDTVSLFPNFPLQLLDTMYTDSDYGFARIPQSTRPLVDCGHEWITPPPKNLLEQVKLQPEPHPRGQIMVWPYFFQLKVKSKGKGITLI